MQIRDNSKEAASGLDALAGTLDKVKTAANGFNMRRVATQLSNLSAVVNGINASGAKRLNDLSFALDRMGKLGNIKISSSVGRQLQSISTAAASLQNVDLSRISALAETLRPLSELRGSRLTSYINQLGRLPEVVQALERSKLDAFVADIRELTVAMTPLGETMEKVANGFNALPTRIQRMVQQTEKFNDTMRRSNTIMQKSKSGGLWGFLNSTHTKWLAVAGVVGMLSNTLGKFVHDSASFEENLNLFTIAMGRYAEEAYNYAEAVQYALGIDVSAWMRNQGVFMQIATGFGVVEDKAYTMSRGLTQIAYDIASFYNIGVDTAMEKVQSGISGELEPLRRLGYALDAATLQQIAYEHGISQSINTMTQAQKSQLRYIAIMEQSENAMGDMARTIESPANSMRVLAMQAEQLGRAMGNLILPVLTKILPYVQAVTVALTDIINHLAVLSGFTMPEISKDNMGGLASGAESVEDALLGASDAAKELRNATLGLDELNVISESSGVGTAGSGYDLPLDLESYKFFDENYENKVAKMAEEIKDALEPLQPFFDGFSDTLEGLFKLLPGFEEGGLLGWLQKLGDWADDHPDLVYYIGQAAGALTIAYGAIKLFDTLGEITAVKKLFEWFGKLTGRSGELKDAFDKKNKSLKDQTKDTLADAAAAVVFSGAAAGVLAALYRLNGWLKENPLTPELNPEPIKASTENLRISFGDTMTYMESKMGTSMDTINGISQEFSAQNQELFKSWSDGVTYMVDITALNLSDKFQQIIDESERTMEEVQRNLEASEKKREVIRREAEKATMVAWGEKEATESSSSSGASQFDSFLDSYYNSGSVASPSTQNPGKTQAEIDKEATDRFWEEQRQQEKIENTLNNIAGIVKDIPDALGAVFGAGSKFLPVPLFASGGYPDEGQLFIARERGAEMVGSIGGRTAVANNDQIVEAIRLAVYDAMVAAGGSEGGDTYVYLDSDPVAARIEKRQREKGQKIYSGGVLA